jgi:hypothetical protein
LLSTCLLAAHATPLQPGPPNSLTNSSWSIEAIIALVGLFVTVVGVLVSLIAFVVSAKLRRRFKRKYYRYSLMLLRVANFALGCVTRNHHHSIQQLRQKYDDYLRFQEWLEMTAM